MNEEPLEFQLDCIEDEIIRLDQARSMYIQSLADTDLLLKNLWKRKEYLLEEIENQASA
jgi:hypothetical protein